MRETIADVATCAEGANVDGCVMVVVLVSMRTVGVLLVSVVAVAAVVGVLVVIPSLSTLMGNEGLKLDVPIGDGFG